MQNLGEQLRIASSCPLCDTAYTQDSATIIEEAGTSFLIHVQCENCETSVVSTMTRGHGGVQSVGLLTDLTRDDVAKFHGEERISSEDVLALHSYLSQFSGRLTRDLQHYS